MILPSIWRKKKQNLIRIALIEKKKEEEKKWKQPQVQHKCQLHSQKLFQIKFEKKNRSLRKTTNNNIKSVDFLSPWNTMAM